VTLEIYDTTLRDGAQGVGINFSVSDKVRIAEHLDHVGVRVIEGGWPGANQTDTEFFAEMRGATFSHARLAAFGANLCTLIPALQLRMGHHVVDEAQLRHLSSVAGDVAEIANLHPPVNAPYVGTSAFTHKGGQHVDAMRKAVYAYQHVDPATVGNRTRSVVSSQSGAANILDRAGELGIDLGEDRAPVRRITARVKELEHRGYAPRSR
jgi:isopropylmalate/homocitrate/citramalate synthase